MDKQTLIRDMKHHVKGASFITATSLARYLGKSDDFAYRLVGGLEKVPGEKKGTKYFIPDVAGRIMEVSR